MSKQSESKKAKTGKCLSCGKTKKIHTKGMCASCYLKGRRKEGKSLSERSRGLMPDVIVRTTYQDYYSGLIRDAISIFQKPPDVPVWQWSRDHIKLPSGQGYAGQTYPNWDIAPDMKYIFEQLKNPECREIVLKFGTQSGKTLFEICAMGYMINHYRANGLFMMPTETLFKRMPKTRLRPVYEISDIGLRADIKGKATIDGLYFEHGNYIAYGKAFNTSSIAELPALWVMVDEVDEIRDVAIDPVELAKSRMRTFKNRSKLVLAGTPKKLDGGMMQAYEAAKRHVIEMPCPFCGEYSVYEFESIKYPKDKDYRYIRANGLACAECPKCKAEIPDQLHDEMVLGNRWRCLDPELPDTAMSFQKRSWEGVFENWSSTAAAYLQKKEKGPDAETDFWNSWAAEPKDLRAQIMSVDEMKLRCTHYQRKEIPADVQAITCGIDLGKESVWVVFLGWAPQNVVYEFWSERIDWAGTDWDRVERGIMHAVNEKWIYKGDNHIKPALIQGCFDSGYLAPNVYDYCRKNPIFKPVKGVVGLNQVVSVSDADPKLRYGGHARGMKLYSIRSYYWQDVLQSYLQTQAETPGSLNLPGDAHRRYIQHLNGEVKRTKMDDKGKISEYWAPVTRMAPRDLRDATIYAIVAGHINNLHMIPAPALTMPEEPKKAPIYTKPVKKSIRY